VEGEARKDMKDDRPAPPFARRALRVNFSGTRERRRAVRPRRADQSPPVPISLPRLPRSQSGRSSWPGRPGGRRGTLQPMVRPERIVVIGDSCCIELTGGSPVAGSAEAPRSRPRASRETLPSKWGVKSPQRVIRPVGGEQVRRPSIKRTLQPREIRIRKETGRPSRSCHGEGNRLHQ
jgi:hypothetical protein